ncbi:hypothetical protein FS749_015405 [Ceratobasidium sp. UAMH 11750]|nr:hypothetical protein FS749_015405 [Ceratobasidium sp. UAMH 11750]
MIRNSADNPGPALDLPDFPNNLASLQSRAFQRWELAHSQLTRTIQSYLEACIALDASCTALASRSLSHLSKESYHRIDMELLNLSSSKESLVKSRAVLAKIRNKSSTLAPISVLPSETLTTIFSMADDECLRNCFASVRSLCRPKAPGFASVCTQWRQLYFRWHVTSSHLDLVVGGEVNDAYYRHAKILAAKSPDAPLHLSIQDRVDNSSTKGDVSSDEVEKLVQFLVPLMPRVHVVDISFKFGSQLLLDSVVLPWVNCGTRVSPKVFKVWNTTGTGLPLQLGGPIELPHEGRVSSEELQHFFAPLQTLALWHCYAPPSASVYKGLTDLRLDILYDESISLDIVECLAASPNIHSLAVDDVKFVEQGESPTTVPLNSLRNLSLSQSKIGNSLKHLFPLLDTGSSSVTVIMRIILNPDFTSESQAFFRRSSVKRLFAYGNERYRYSSVASICPAPDLQELVLRDCSLRVEASGDSPITDEGGCTSTPWPLLHTLYLIGCTIEFETLQKLVSLHPIRKVRVHNGYIQMDERRKMTVEEHAKLEELLESQEGIDVKCVPDEVGCPTRLNFFDRMYA